MCGCPHWGRVQPSSFSFSWQSWHETQLLWIRILTEFHCFIPEFHPIYIALTEPCQISCDPFGPSKVRKCRAAKRMKVDMHLLKLYQGASGMLPNKLFVGNQWKTSAAWPISAVPFLSKTEVSKRWDETQRGKGTRELADCVAGTGGTRRYEGFPDCFFGFEWNFRLRTFATCFQAH